MTDVKYRTKICRYSQEGFWVIRNEKEYFISYSDYPVLGKEDISQLSFFMEKPNGDLYWEKLDVTVSLPSE